MFNDVIVLVITVFWYFVRRFFANAASLPTYVEIYGITAAIPVFGFMLRRVWFGSRRNT
jgi:hypothetical protein